MTKRAVKNTWVEIHRIVLEPGERAPQVPVDTRQVPLEMRAKGFLKHDAAVGEKVEITTSAGRNIQGTLAAINPAYAHSFGRPIPELSTIGAEIRQILVQKDQTP